MRLLDRNEIEQACLFVSQNHIVIQHDKNDITLTTKFTTTSIVQLFISTYICVENVLTWVVNVCQYCNILFTDLKFDWFLFGSFVWANWRQDCRKVSFKAHCLYLWLNICISIHTENYIQCILITSIKCMYSKIR